MADEKFPKVSPGAPISADRANKEGRVLERVAQMRPGSGMDGRHGDSVLQFSRTLDAKVASLKVTDASNAPVYLGVLRQYSFVTDEWTDGEKLWKIDAGATNSSFSVDDYVVAYYDRKRGAFIPVVGGSGHRVIEFRVISAAPFIDEELPVCTSVLASVENISCGATTPAIGTEVIIWDPGTCWFTVPLDLLIGSYGTAVEMARVGDWDVLQDCLDYGTLEGSCWWMVTGLCCTENIYGQ